MPQKAILCYKREGRYGEGKKRKKEPDERNFTILCFDFTTFYVVLQRCLLTDKIIHSHILEV